MQVRREELKRDTLNRHFILQGGIESPGRGKTPESSEKERGEPPDSAIHREIERDSGEREREREREIPKSIEITPTENLSNIKSFVVVVYTI